MKKLYIDTNIVLDLLAKRDKFYKSAAILFSLADNTKIQLAVSSLTFANTYYILSKELKQGKVKEILRKFKLLVKILPMNEKIIELSLNSEFNDFEDAIQYYTASVHKYEIIITRNLKDFKHSKIPVMTADQYLVLFE